MLIQLSRWNTTSFSSSTNTTTSIKNNTGVSMRASTTTIIPSSLSGGSSSSNSGSHQKRKRSNAFSKKLSAIVVTSPHSITCYSSSVTSSIPSDMKKEWTISSRPGLSHAFLPNKKDLVDIPSMYDANQGRLYTVVNKNTSIQIYSNNEKDIPEHIYKTIPLPTSQSSSHFESLQLYHPNVSSSWNSTIVVGCTNDAKLMIVANGGDYHQIIDVPTSIVATNNGSNNTTVSLQKESLRHLWMGITHSNNEDKSSVRYTVTSVWLDRNPESEQLLIQRVSFSIGDNNDDNLGVHSQLHHVLNFRKRIMNQVDMDSIRACSLSPNSFALFFQSSSATKHDDTKELKKYWFCCYCEVDDVASAHRKTIDLKSNCPFVLFPKDQQISYPMDLINVCALTPTIVAMYKTSASSESFPKISLVDVSRDGIVVSSTNSQELPILNDPTVRMVSNPSLQQLVLYTRDSMIATSSLQFSSSSMEQPLSKKSRSGSVTTPHVKPTLANLLASSLSNQSLPESTMVTNSHSIIVTITDDELEDHVRIETDVSKYLHELTCAKDPISFETIFDSSKTGLLNLMQDIQASNLQQQEEGTFKKKTKSMQSKQLPPSFIEKVCQLCLDILESSYGSNLLTEEDDPIIRVLLNLINLNSNIACQSIFHHVDSSVEDIPSLIVLYKLLSCNPSKMGGMLTEVFRVDAWRYILLNTDIEQVVGFYLYCMREQKKGEEENAKTSFLPNTNHIETIVLEWMKLRSKHLTLQKDNNELDEPTAIEEKKNTIRLLSRTGRQILSHFMLDFSERIIVEKKCICNNALLRSAFYHQDIQAEHELDLELCVLTSLMKKHGPISMNRPVVADSEQKHSMKKAINDKLYYSRQGMENVIQWVNAILDVHGSILARSKYKDAKSCIYLLYNVVLNELNASQDLIDLQACLMVVMDSLDVGRTESGIGNDEKNLGRDGQQGISHSNTNSHDGSLIIPSYGVERLCL